MAKHIVSVCIFCFLCATHSPCASHAEVTHGATQYHGDRIPFKELGETAFANQEAVAENRMKRHVNSVGRTITNNRFKRDINNINSSVQKLGDKSDEYIKKLFNFYGDGKSITLEAFQKLMKRIDLLGKLNSELEIRSTHSGHVHEDHQNESATTNPTGCINEDLYSSIKKEVNSTNGNVIDVNILKHACPAILYSLVAGSCSHTDLSSSYHDDDSILTQNSHIHAWFYSLLAITIISACGVLGLAVIPIMQKKFYQPLLQFLVALAVGTLAGDALLHLLPHAMMAHEEHDGEHSHNSHSSSHDQNMWKGFVAMLGLIFFFLMERIIMLAAKWRKKQQLKNKLPSKLNIIKPEISTQLTNAVDKQCKHKYSSFPYCYDEIKMDPDGPHEDHVFQVTAGENWESHNNTASTGLDEMGSHSDVHACHTHKIEKNQNMTECPNESTNLNCSEINKMLSSEINKMLVNDNKDDTDSLEYTVILREHDNPHHGHSHTHGHVHAAPKTMSSVAWMVIMGDGLHNFTDGMAIGAAFANGVAGGFSTTVAVFCHELPHELGDFAMLLKAGMSMKQALFYNLLSSILCLLGNIFGLWLGNTEHASSWIFAAAAGMFLYIALVDMIPELSSGHEAQGTFLQCILHLGGLLLGFSVMALIAFYEHDLKSIFHDS